MKKFKLEISKPCHQDWNTMTTEEQGRFCKSCQKTVVDFTGMSDRQLAEFFRKPKGEVCGRLYNDQLERAITIPKKRIPWFRYFFQFTWPAFVFFLKSCGNKSNSIGKVSQETQTPITFRDDRDLSEILNSKIITLGNLNMDYEIKQDSEFPDLLMKELEPLQLKEEKLSRILVDSENVPAAIAADSSSPFPESVMDTAVMDTVWIETRNSILMGALSFTRCTTYVTKEEVQVESPVNDVKKSQSFHVYPNPVGQGNLLTVSYSEVEGVPDLVQIFSSSGQLIYSLEQKPSEESLVFNIRIPAHVSAGVYFLRMVNKKNNQQHTERIMVK